MAKSGPNYQTTEVVPYGERRYLRPPDTLSDAQRRCFIDLVTSLPSSHFKPGDISLLCRYAEAAAAAEQAAFEMTQPGGMLSADGSKPSAWFSIHQQATKSLNALALPLGIGCSHSRRRDSRTFPMSIRSNWNEARRLGPRLRRRVLEDR
jgi:hypothetical protein